MRWLARVHTIFDENPDHNTLKTIQDHITLATACELKSFDASTALFSSAPITLSGTLLPILAYAHSVLATACELKSFDASTALFSSASKRDVFRGRYFFFGHDVERIGNLLCSKFVHVAEGLIL